MFIAMNRFKIKPGSEDIFTSIWENRDSQLPSVPGFKKFHLVRGETTDKYTLFASHVTWESKQAFENWTKSKAFKQAHAGSGKHRDIHVAHPKFEGFEVVL